MFTRNYVRPVPRGNHGPDEHLAPYKYPVNITTRDCILALSDYPDNRYYIPTEKLIDDVFDRIIEVTEIRPLKVFNDEEKDSELTYNIIKNILLLTQDRNIMYETTGRFWQMFATIWWQYSELSRQHLIQIYKGIYRDSEGTTDSRNNSNGSSTSTSNGENLSKGTNDGRSTNGTVSTSQAENESDSDTRSTGTTLPQDRVDHIMNPRTDILDYADNASVNLNNTKGHNESLSTSDGEAHNWGWNFSKGQNTSVSKSVNRTDGSSTSFNTGMNKGVFAIYDQWVRSYRDMTGGLYYQMHRAGLWSIFI